LIIEITSFEVYENIFLDMLGHVLLLCLGHFYWHCTL